MRPWCIISAECRGEEEMMTRTRGKDLVAVEAKYHRGCYQRYNVIASSSMSSGGQNTCIPTMIVHFFYDMVALLSMYRRHLID